MVVETSRAQSYPRQTRNGVRERSDQGRGSRARHRRERGERQGGQRQEGFARANQ